jgi:hypothetical protein
LIIVVAVLVCGLSFFVCWCVEYFLNCVSFVAICASRLCSIRRVELAVISGRLRCLMFESSLESLLHMISLVLFGRIK